VGIERLFDLDALFSSDYGLPANHSTSFATQRIPPKFQLSGANSACFGPIKQTNGVHT
jgi:hypothetical protein